MKRRKLPATGLLKYCAEHVDKHTGHSLKTWMSFYKLLRLFEVHHSPISYRLMTNSFCKNTISEFLTYLVKERQMKQNTVYASFNMLRSMLYRCYMDGFDVDVWALKNTRVRRTESTAVYLTLAEMKSIEELELSGTLDYIRDHFLISCYTGLRFEDHIGISKDNVVNGVMTVITKKTLTKVLIPVHTVVEKILNRYQGAVPSNFTVSYYNMSLKRIAAKAEINQTVLSDNKSMPKYSFIASRTGRRTFATNMYLINPKASVYPIMLITGHKTEESFFRSV